MQYKYYYTTHRRQVGSKEFNDFFEAVQYMNQHVSSTYGIITAGIIDTNTKEIICAHRKVK